ncbi:uncharacterized protein LOC104883787 isoform X2 [Beta vulgaris subsp. vulgaris]|uniref:uncharacterized protein LOC104883787 isoform X2 n=1 Tax=Beta vulgaris subsp. vulgaris TaxID=3555 RepID=UPI0020367AE9|nr:uncharacterized protein LOC104883787 isoform X2 [Beta vulgaris subsp. vulgaris]
MEDFEKKVIISENMQTDESDSQDSRSKTLILLRKFLSLQQRRAEAYTKLRELVCEVESQFLKPDCSRDDLARLLRAVQELERVKLQLTARMQVLKKAGRPSERLVTHENCSYKKPAQHECVHVHELTDAAGTEEAEADADYDNAVKEAIKGVQEAVTSINEHLEEVRYEIAALESE